MKTILKFQVTKEIKMKIRQGFVSNSSSSSFCLIGSEYGWDELENVLKENYPEYTTNNHWTYAEKFSQKLEEKGFTVYMGEDCILFGYPVKTDTTIDSQIEWTQEEFRKHGIKRKAFFDFGEISC